MMLTFLFASYAAGIDFDKRPIKHHPRAWRVGNGWRPCRVWEVFLPYTNKPAIVPQGFDEEDSNDEAVVPIRAIRFELLLQKIKRETGLDLDR